MGSRRGSVRHGFTLQGTEGHVNVWHEPRLRKALFPC
jgi:hypothetical protein